MKVATNEEGDINVEACYTHNGHEKEMQHTFLSKVRRQGTKLQQSVSDDKIFDDRDDAINQSN